MNFDMVDLFVFFATVFSIGLLIYIVLDAHGYFKKTPEAQEETKKKNKEFEKFLQSFDKDEELKRRKEEEE